MSSSNRPGPHTGPAWERGARLLQDAVSWASLRGPPLDEIATFHVRLLARWDNVALESGTVSCWYAAPDAFRYDVETPEGGVRWLVVGGEAWVVRPDGRVEDVAATPGGTERLAALRARRDDLLDAVACITLGPLRAALGDVCFLGCVRQGGPCAGPWLEVATASDAGRHARLWLAYEQDEGRDLRALWPGVVRLGSLDRDPYAVDWILSEWRGPTGTRRACPRRIEAHAVSRQGRAGVLSTRILRATVITLEVNQHLGDPVFRRETTSRPR